MFSYNASSSFLLYISNGSLYTPGLFGSSAFLIITRVSSPYRSLIEFSAVRSTKFLPSLSTYSLGLPLESLPVPISTISPDALIAN